MPAWKTKFGKKNNGEHFPQILKVLLQKWARQPAGALKQRGGGLGLFNPEDWTFPAWTSSILDWKVQSASSGKRFKPSQSYKSSIQDWESSIQDWKSSILQKFNPGLKSSIQDWKSSIQDWKDSSRPPRRNVQAKPILGLKKFKPGLNFPSPRLELFQSGIEKFQPTPPCSYTFTIHFLYISYIFPIEFYRFPIHFLYISYRII